MPFVLALSALLALLIGVVLGMLGGGGAILTLPLLVYVLRVEPKTAIATSLFVVGTTSAVATVMHARAGAVRWKIAAIFGLAAVAGAYSGGRLARLVPATALLVLFGIVMVTTSLAMLRAKKESEPATPERALRLGRMVVLGSAVGLLSGLIGAGGGFLIVPVLSLFGGLALREAIGTSIFVITLQSFAGFAGHAAHVELEWTLVLELSGAAALGSIVGSAAGKKVPTTVLRRAFAWLVLAMGIFMFATNLPPRLAVIASGLTLLALAISRPWRSRP